MFHFSTQFENQETYTFLYPTIYKCDILHWKCTPTVLYVTALTRYFSVHYRIDFNNLLALYITIVVLTVHMMALGVLYGSLCSISFSFQTNIHKSFVWFGLCLLQPPRKLPEKNFTLGYSVLLMTLYLDEQMAELFPTIWLFVNYLCVCRVCVHFIKIQIFIKLYPY